MAKRTTTHVKRTKRTKRTTLTSEQMRGEAAATECITMGCRDCADCRVVAMLRQGATASG